MGSEFRGSIRPSTSFFSCFGVVCRAGGRGMEREGAGGGSAVVGDE